MPTSTDPAALVRTLAAKAGPAVVGLGKGWQAGSGVVVAQDRVLTVAHAATTDGNVVTFADGSRSSAKVHALDPDSDLAVLDAQTGDITPVALSDAAHPGLGAPVIALADPGGRGLRVTHGLTSSEARTLRGPSGRRIEGAIEHTAPLPGGSAGSPLLAPDGTLLGLNAIRAGAGLTLALPAGRATVERLARGETTQRARLGVAIAPPHVARRMRRAVGLPDRDGLLVRAVHADGPAARAGIERGDLLTAMSSRPISGLDTVQDALDALQPPASLTLTLLRGLEERDVTIDFS